MANGPGKYDRITSFVREATDAKAVIVIVFDGNQGTGFSIQSNSSVLHIEVAETLENVAAQIRASVNSIGDI